uniref:CBS domain protein n=1 Tax=Angiostrongylus cantonensis TaxID=6313 RepID=A0A158P9F2_ANGCA
MRVVDCYELSPPFVNIIVLDKSLKVDKAFSALCEQNVRAGLVWDSSQERICSIVTLTDFLAYLQHDVAKWSSVEIGELISGSPLVAVSADTKVIAACEEFCFHGVHRIIVNEPHSGDILYLLTIRRVLKAIHKQNRSLHFAQWLNSSIKDSGVGTWENGIHSVSMDDTLNDVVEKLLTHKLSSLPVVDLNGQATDVITKIDFAVALMESDDPQRFLRETTVSTVLGHRPATVFVRPCDPVGKVLDVLLEAKHMRCVFVVDERLKPIACVSQCDVISHLIHSDAPFQKS